MRKRDLIVDIGEMRFSSVGYVLGEFSLEERKRFKELTKRKRIEDIQTRLQEIIKKDCKSYFYNYKDGKYEKTLWKKLKKGGV